MRFDPSWTPEARALLSSAFARHGGVEAWEKLGPVRIRPISLRGMLPLLKGFSNTFHFPSLFEIDAHERRVLFRDFPEGGRHGEYHAGSVRLLEGERTLEEIPRARDTFSGFTKNRLWMPADALYFFGYAWCAYLGFPFLLAGQRFRGLSRLRDQGEDWRGITVEFGPGVETHSPVQTFYFDATGLLRRNDYVADIVGSWATGAHYSGDYRSVGGIQLAMHRLVKARLGTMALPVTVL